MLMKLIDFTIGEMLYYFYIKKYNLIILKLLFLASYSLKKFIKHSHPHCSLSSVCTIPFDFILSLAVYCSYAEKCN